MKTKIKKYLKNKKYIDNKLRTKMNLYKLIKNKWIQLNYIDKWSLVVIITTILLIWLTR
jgi:hypothetical protein